MGGSGETAGETGGARKCEPERNARLESGSENDCFMKRLHKENKNTQQVRKSVRTKYERELELMVMRRGWRERSKRS